MQETSVKPKYLYLLLIILGIAVISTFAVSRTRGGLDTDSCNYAVVAKEILRTNQWLRLYDPVYEGVFYYHFPLSIWITAIFFKLFGVTAFVAKLFSMLSLIILTLGVFYFGKLLKNYWVGFFAGLSLLFTNHIVRLAMQCRMDIPVSLFITLALFSFVLAQRRSRLYYLLFGLFTCLAIFTKDVVGLFPLAIVFVYLTIRLKWKEFFHPLFIAGLLITIGPVISWIWLDKANLFSRWWSWNFLHLLKSPSFGVPWYYYLWAITTKYFYFFGFAIYGGYLAIKEAWRRKSYELYLVIIWAIIFPLAFSFGRQKLHYFILPMYPATSLLVGLAFDHIFGESLKIKIAKVFQYLLIIGIIVMLCFPLNLRSKYFWQTMSMAPFIDELLKQVPQYEFIVYRQDVAALLFYTQYLTRIKYFKDKNSLEEALSTSSDKAQLGYFSEVDFLQLAPLVREKFRTVIKCGDKIIVTNVKNSQLTVIIPK